MIAHCERTATGILTVLAVAILLGTTTFADEITTTKGQRIVGKVIEETMSSVLIQTTTGNITLPKTLIKNLKRENIGEDEKTGDLAIIRKDYYDALKSYELARDRNEGSSALAAKIKAVRERINQKERDLYESLFQKAVEQSNQGNHDASRQTFQSIMNQAPKDGPSWRKARIGIAYQYFCDALNSVDRVEYRQAIADLEKASQTDPSLAIIQFQMARFIKRYADDRAKALACYDNGLNLAKKEMAMDKTEIKDLESITPKEALINTSLINECRFEKAQILLDLGKKQEAADQFLALFQEDPKNYNKAAKYITEIYTSDTTKMDYAKVLKGLDVALSVEKDSARAWFLKGRIFLDTGDPVKAIDAFGRAIETDAAMPEAHYYRARAELRIGEAVQARRDLEEELQIVETYRLRCELGKVLLIGAEYDKALENYNRAIQMDSETATALLGRARAYRLKAMATKVSKTNKEDFLKKADEDTSSVLKQNKKNREAILERGLLFKDQKKTTEAIDSFKNVIDDLLTKKDELKTEDKQLMAEAYGERGMIYLDNDDKNQAQADFEQSLKYDKNYAIAYSKIGEIAQKNKNFDVAKKNFSKAIELGPDNADFELQLGFLYQEYLKDFNKALSHYRAYEKKGGINPRVKGYIQECQNALETK